MATNLQAEEARIRLGGGPKAIDRQHEKGRLTARERIAKLLDPGEPLFELGLWAAWGMYAGWGGAPSAGVVTGVGTVAGRRVMVIANGGIEAFAEGDAVYTTNAFFRSAVDLAE